TNGTNASLNNLLIWDFNTATCYGIEVGANGSATARNCAIYYGNGMGIDTGSASATCTVQNCSVYGVTGYGVSKTAGTLTATNTIAMGCTTADFSGGVTQDYNMSSDASASGAHSLPSRTASSQFVSILSGNQNLHIQSGSAAKDTASDLSASFTTDIDN